MYSAALTKALFHSKPIQAHPAVEPRTQACIHCSQLNVLTHFPAGRCECSLSLDFSRNSIYLLRKIHFISAFHVRCSLQPHLVRTDVCKSCPLDSLSLVGGGGGFFPRRVCDTAAVRVHFGGSMWMALDLPPRICFWGEELSLETPVAQHRKAEWIVQLSMFIFSACFLNSRGRMGMA